MYLFGEASCRACPSTAKWQEPWATPFRFGAFPFIPETYRNSEHRLEVRQPRSFSIKCQRVGTTCPRIERSDQSIFEASAAVLQDKSSIEDLLLVLNFK